MRGSKKFSRNRAHGVQVAKATRHKQEEPCGTFVGRQVEVEGVEGEAGCFVEIVTGDRETIETLGPKQSGGNSPDEATYEATTHSRGLHGVPSMEDKEKRENSRPECHTKNEAEGPPSGNQSKPLVNYSSLLYKNYPKKVAGIKVTKKFLLMSKGLKWKQPNIEDMEVPANKDHVSSIYQDNLPETRPEVIRSNSASEDLNFANEETEDDIVLSTVDDMGPSIIRDPKTRPQIAKRNKSNFRKIMTKYNPKAHSRWQPNKTANSNNVNDRDSICIVSFDRFSPTNVGNHNSTRMCKPQEHLDSGNPSRYAYDSKELMSKSDRCHTRVRGKSERSKSNDYEPTRYESHNNKKTKRSPQDCVRRHHQVRIPSKIPIFVKKENRPHCTPGTYRKENFLLDSELPSKAGPKPILLRHATNVIIEKRLPDVADRSRQREFPPKSFEITKCFSPRRADSGPSESEDLEDVVKAVKYDAPKVRHDSNHSSNKYYRSANAYHSNETKISAGKMRKEARDSQNLENHKVQSCGYSFEEERPQKLRCPTPEINVDRDVQEIQNLLSHHRQHRVDVNDKEEPQNSGGLGSTSQDSAAIKDMRVLRTSFPFQSQENKSTVGGKLSPAPCKATHEPLREANSEDAGQQSKSPRQENSKKELNRVVKMLLKRQDSQLKNNLLRYLMEELEKNKQKKKVPDIMATKSKKRVFKDPCKNSRSISPVQRQQKKNKDVEKFLIGSMVNSVSSRMTPWREPTPPRYPAPDLPIGADDSLLFARKVMTYKNMYRNHEVANLISEAPKINSCRVPNISFLNEKSNSNEDEISRSMKFSEGPSSKTDKPFRNWLKSNNMIANTLPEPSLRTEHFSILEEPPSTHQDDGNKDVDISHLFSVDNGLSYNCPARVEPEYANYDLSPTDYFFRSLSRAGTNNNNVKPLSKNLIENSHLIGTKPCQDSHKSCDERLKQTNLGKRLQTHELPAQNMNVSNRRLVQQLSFLNRRHTKKPIKMSMLPCKWGSGPMSPNSTTSFTSKTQQSVASSGAPMIKGWKNSFNVTSPETVRSMSFNSDKSIQIARNGPTRTIFH